jgi:nucleotide-binding universal stress UspA family protein
MFDNVMVAVSDDEGALDALALGKALASPGAALTLVHIEIDRSNGAQGDTALPPPLVSVPAGADDARYPFVVFTAWSAAVGLHALARRGSADVLVIGASRRDGVDRAAGRDPAQAIIENAPCAVAIAPVGYAGRAAALRTIGVGYDGSLAADEALAAARRLAAEQDAELSAATPFAGSPHPPSRHRSAARHGRGPR